MSSCQLFLNMNGRCSFSMFFCKALNDLIILFGRFYTCLMEKGCCSMCCNSPFLIILMNINSQYVDRMYSSIYQLLLHKAQINYIKNIVLTQVSGFPIGKFCIRYSQQPFLQCSNIECTVSIYIACYRFNTTVFCKA